MKIMKYCNHDFELLQLLKEKLFKCNSNYYFHEGHSKSNNKAFSFIFKRQNYNIGNLCIYGNV